MSRPDEKAIWDAWARGESRCPHCLESCCPADWASMCDCFMAPASDEWCEKCRASLAAFDALVLSDDPT